MHVITRIYTVSEPLCLFIRIFQRIMCLSFIKGKNYLYYLGFKDSQDGPWFEGDLLVIYGFFGLVRWLTCSFFPCFPFKSYRVISFLVSFYFV